MSDTKGQDIEERGSTVQLLSAKRGGHAKFSPYLRALLCITSFLWAVHSIYHSFHPSASDAPGPLPASENSSTCPQVTALHSSKHANLEIELDGLYAKHEFKLHTYEALGGAIRIPSESFDDLDPVGEDPRWDIFQQFHEYLETQFPLVYSKLSLTKVNTYGLVYHWQGSDEALKPFLIMAHQDVVPVDPSTVDQWLHPPFSGHFDGEWIWGRGSVDDKADLIALLVSVETLLEKDFKPDRTIVLAFGFDEESSGTQGAGQLNKYLESTYGTNGFAMILDEGAGTSGPRFGGDVIFASPGVSEKGYMDIRLEVSTNGGHSSIPPAHTSIGLLSRLVVSLEDHPHAPALLRTGTAFAAVQCAAIYGPSYPKHLRHLARAALTDDTALAELQDGLIAMDKVNAAVLGTTQAVDLIEGGVKVNALPESATAIVNHRIAEHSSLAELENHVTELMLPIAHDYNLTLNSFGGIYAASDEPKGEMTITDAFGTALEPSPITPSGTSGPWQVLAGTIKATYESSNGYNATGVVVAPGLGLGNTDTRFYWSLTRHIFRYSHRNAADMYNGLHTVNEAVRAESVMEQVRFFTKLILNTDESSAL